MIGTRGFGVLIGALAAFVVGAMALSLVIGPATISPVEDSGRSSPMTAPCRLSYARSDCRERCSPP